MKTYNPNEEIEQTVTFRDELFRSQIAALGITSFQKLQKMKILILNCKAVGVELCKNILLSFPNKIAIVDDSIVTASDLSYNFFIGESEIGMHRSHALANALRKNLQSKMPRFNQNDQKAVEENKITTEIEHLPFSSLIENTIKQYDLFICSDYYD